MVGLWLMPSLASLGVGIQPSPASKIFGDSDFLWWLSLSVLPEAAASNLYQPEDEANIKVGREREKKTTSS